MTNSIAMQENILPFEYKFEKEAELRKIIFEKNIAFEQEKYLQSVAKADEHKIAVEIQRSVKTGIQEFFKSKDLVINLVLSMFLWGTIVYCYQINDYYDY